MSRDSKIHLYASTEKVAHNRVMADISVVPAYVSPFPSPSPSSSSKTSKIAIEGVDPGDQQMIQEILDHQEKMQKAVQDIQAKQDFFLPVGKIMSAAQDPRTFKLLQSISDIHREPTVYYFYSLEFVWFLAIILFRSWRKFKSISFLKNLWIQAYTTFIYFLGASVAIPLLFLDREAKEALWELIQKFIHS